jgi:hypothetical protein
VGDLALGLSGSISHCDSFVHREARVETPTHLS